MAYNQGFAPIANKKAVVLILGSMPSVASLQKQQYYAHPRNAFWPIMQRLFDAPAELAYGKKKALLKQHRIAVWDVLAACFRPGSLDSAIDDQSILPNDFADFFAGHKFLRQVFLNGGKAEQMYNKQVLPQVRERWPNLQYTRLPSTSPAMAALTLEKKTEHWRAVLQALEE
ncbi:MAG: DNA-deoxyinosine glycosylase [Pseudomonadales bacterium]